MITGDNKDSATYYAKETGLIDEYDRGVLILEGH